MIASQELDLPIASEFNPEGYGYILLIPNHNKTQQNANSA